MHQPQPVSRLMNDVGVCIGWTDVIGRVHGDDSVFEGHFTLKRPQKRRCKGVSPLALGHGVTQIDIKDSSIVAHSQLLLEFNHVVAYAPLLIVGNGLPGVHEVKACILISMVEPIHESY